MRGLGSVALLTAAACVQLGGLDFVAPEDGGSCPTGFEKCANGFCYREGRGCPATDAGAGGGAATGGGAAGGATGGGVTGGGGATGGGAMGGGGANGGGATGGGADAGCSPTTCPAGCCEDGVCLAVDQQTVKICGLGGAACAPCDRVRFDSCVTGQCRCGNTSCGVGQHCLGNVCVCDATSCPDDCCTGNEVCLPGDAGTTCGRNGASCASCPSTCSANTCTGCGSCVGGCCWQGTCQVNNSLNLCGTDGGVCLRCSYPSADGCGDGQCRCGGSPACGPGRRCSGGQCICDEVACPQGCCAATGCQGRSMVACGIDAGACVACDARFADRCAPDGTCRCGAQPACTGGSFCDGGHCQ